MILTTQKKEIVQWLKTVEDPKIIEQINLIRKEKVDFDALLKDCIQVEVLKQKTTDFITSLPWKK
uniref:hypothetical protein n=1 Tax=Flavobacterium sp. TaxID=239 RepID=UPI00404B81F9